MSYPSFPWIFQLQTRCLGAFQIASYISQFGSTGLANGQFNNLNLLSASSGGYLWVADSSNHRVKKFNSSGTFQMGIGAGYNGVGGAIGSSGVGSGQFYYPAGIAIDGSGNIWVTDFLNNRIQKFNSSGTWLLTIPA